MDLQIVLYAAGALVGLCALLGILRILIAPSFALLIRDAPLTNLTILFGVAAAGTVLIAWVVACVFLEKPEPGGLTEIVALLIGLLTAGAGMQTAKRFSFKPGLPQDAEDSSAWKPSAVKAVTDLGLPAPATRPAPIAPSAAPDASATPIGPQNRNDTAEPGLPAGEGD